MKLSHVVWALALSGCSNTSTIVASDGGTCVPGMSVACTDTNGCMGAQVCAADGLSFGACVCGVDMGVPDQAGLSDLAQSPDLTPQPDLLPQVVVTVAPPSTLLNPGQKQTFTASVTGTPATGVFWTVKQGSAGGYVTSDGAYYAPSTLGTYEVIATSMADPTKTGSATVTVTSTPQVSVSISPAMVTVQPGAPQSFNATVTGDSNTLVTWSATGGSIDSNGNYQAPSLGGTYHVTATSQANSTKTDTAIVIVPVPSVSGTISYSGTVTGRVYLTVTQDCCGSEVVAGTSVAGPGPYTIHGVPQGALTITAWRDKLGIGKNSAADLAGKATVNVSAVANFAGTNITLTDPAPTAPPAPNLDGAFGGADAAIVVWKGSTDSSGAEQADHYKVYCSTSSTPNDSNSMVRTVLAGSGFSPIQPLTPGTYYCAVAGVIGGLEGAKAISPPLTVGPPASSGFGVTGNVTFGGTARGSLYLIGYNPTAQAVSFVRIPSPSSPQAYALPVSQSGPWGILGFVDQEDDGYLSPTDPQTDLQGNNLVTINGPSTAGPLIAIPQGPANLNVTSGHLYYSNGGEQYEVRLPIVSAERQPVAATLISAPNLSVPIDVGIQNSSGSGGGTITIGVRARLNTTVPTVEDTYLFDVSFADGTSVQLAGNLAVAPIALPTQTAPSGSGVSTQPTLSWTAPNPAPASPYTYEIDIQPANGGSSVFRADTVLSTTTSLPWSGPALNGGTTYRWRVYVHDAAGNESMREVEFTTQ